MILFKPIHAIVFISFSLLVIYFTIPSRKDLGMYYFNSYEYDKAVSYLVSEGDVASDDIFVLKKLKDYSLIQGDVNKAFQTQLKLVSLKPKNREYLVEAEKLAAWSERTFDRLRLKERRALLEKQNNPQLSKKLLLEVAQGFRYIKNFSNSDRVFAQVGVFKERRYKEAAIRYFLARKNAPKSEELLKEFAALYPNDSELATFYFQTLMFQGKFSEAKITLLHSLFPQKRWQGQGTEELIKELKATKQVAFFQQKDKLAKLLQVHFTLRNEGSLSDGDFLKLLETYQKHQRFSQMVMGFLRKTTNDSDDFFNSLVKLARRVKPRGSGYREVHVELAEIFISNKNFQEAIVDLERLTKRFPLNRRYWEMLAEVYELNGDKQKSIRAYFKLYKLQKRKVDQSYIKSIPTRYLYVQVSRLETGPIIPRNFKPRAKDIALQKLKSVEGRLIGTIYSLKEPLEKLAAFESLIKESPESIDAYKGKGFSLFELGRAQAGIAVFKYVYTLNPKDADANRALVSTWINAGKWKNLERAQSILAKKYSSQEVDGLLRDFYYFKDKKKYQNFCQLTQSSSAQIDCLYRTGKEEQALELAIAENQKDQKSCDFLIKRLFLETEFGDLDWPVQQKRENAHYKRCVTRATEDDLERFLYSQNQFRKSGQFWRYQQSFGLLETEQFELADTQILLMRKLKNWALTVEAQRDWVVHRGDADFSFVNVGVSAFLDNNSAVTVGPTQTLGDKRSLTGAFARYTLNERRLFFSAEGFSHKPLRFTRDLATESSAYGSGLEIYSNYRSLDREFLMIGFANIQRVNYRNNHSLFSQYTLEGLKRVYSTSSKKPFELLTGLQLSNNNLANARPVLRDNFLNKSLALHGVLKLDFNYPENFFPRKWSGFVRLGVGGDFVRDVDFFDSVQLTGQINKAIGKRSKIFASGEYYSEFLGVNRGNTKLFRLGILQDF